MSSRISKKPSAKKQRSSTDSRHAQILLIEEFGYNSMPYSFYSAKGFRYRVATTSNRCLECIRRGKTCDASGVSVVVGACAGVFRISGFLTKEIANRIIAEKHRIEREEEATKEALLRSCEALEAAQKKIADSLDYLARLQKQQNQVISRGEELIRRGAYSLDELDAVERADLEAVVAVQSLVHTDLIDWNSLDFDDLILPVRSITGESPSEGVAHR